MGLRKGQKELVENYRGGYCAVPAIPGGGKTYCLSQWAVEMIEQGLTKPGKILIVTYMNSAVNNFKQRISKELQKRGITSNKDYFVSTIHGLCLQIIKEKPDLIIASDEFDIIDGVEKIHLISFSIDEWRRKNEERFRYFIEESNQSASKLTEIYKWWHGNLAEVVLSAIGDFKTRGISPKEAIARCRMLSDTSLLKCAAEIYEIYDKRLKIRGLLDFDDMLYNARKLLMEDELLLEKYRNKYSFVCEDEAQDSNLIQSEILALIANGNLLRVGDSNQAICGTFSNSDFTLFRDFCNQPGTTVYHITESSRNTREIIDLANYFVKYVREAHPVEQCRECLLSQYIEPVGIEDENRNPVIPEYGIKAGIFSSWEEEVIGIVNQVSYTLKEHPEKTAAILVPTIRKMGEIVKRLEARNIPFEQLDNASGERNRTVKTLGRIIDFIASPESGEKLALMMNECFVSAREEASYKPGEGEKPESIGPEQKKVLADFLLSYPVEKLIYPVSGEIDFHDIPDGLLKMEIWTAFTEKLELVRDLLEFPSTVVEKLILYIAEKLEFDREQRAIAQKVAGDVRYLMSQVPRWKLTDLAVELLSPKNIFNYFAGVVWDLKGYEPKPGVVTISTYHKSKGLEWDIVFLTGLNYADFPVKLNDKFIGEYWFLKQNYRNPRAIVKSELDSITGKKPEGDSILESKIENISEKARLLYVGITRAKEYLFLSGFHSNPGKRNEAPASEYLLVLKRYIDREAAKKEAAGGSSDAAAAAGNIQVVNI